MASENETNDNPTTTLTSAEAAIIEMMKQHAMSSSNSDTSGGEALVRAAGRGGEQGSTKHAFWDTQVRKRRSINK
jgi:hypothetical protein